MSFRANRTKKLAYWALAAAIVVGTGWLIWGNLWTIRIVPVSQSQIGAILDDGLRWHEPKIDGPTMGPKELAKFALDPRLTAASAFYRASARRPNILDFKAPIRASWPLANELERVCRGKTLVIPWSRFDVPPSFGDSKALSKFLAAQVMLEVATKDRVRCFDAAMRLLDWDRFIARWQTISLIDVLVKQACFAIDLRAIETAIVSAPFDERQIRQLYGAMSVPDELSEEFANAIKHEFQFEFLPLAQEIRTPEALDTVLQQDVYSMTLSDDQDHADMVAGELNWPATLKKEADLVKIYIANCSKPWPSQDPSADRESRRIEKLLPQEPDVRKNDIILKKWWLKGTYKQKLKSLPNGLGLAVIATLGPAIMANFVETAFRGRTERDAARLLTALSLYRRLHRKLPASLAELASLHLPGSAPRDAYADGPFHYNPAKCIFWSIGKNGVDDGGLEGKTRFNSPDMVWHI